MPVPPALRRNLRLTDRPVSTGPCNRSQHRDTLKRMQTEWSIRAPTHRRTLNGVQCRQMLGMVFLGRPLTPSFTRFTGGTGICLSPRPLALARADRRSA
jgi:hypothetical protein